ncbi:hypothetical protein DIURU_005126 [Diutina rugosa]|uniref:Uncharacterized protein n=1 Tax=Diutina rugosa TaxID=5481 RepID=A0A642UEN7_DIURU|nr:uncharacterized protein DIURU_005126 [Diutina rugosa]KAA8897695.1 hypothetical protein DIURU_005126 [Diutina rugosa]
MYRHPHLSDDSLRRLSSNNPFRQMGPPPVQSASPLSQSVPEDSSFAQWVERNRQFDADHDDDDHDDYEIDMTR